MQRDEPPIIEGDCQVVGEPPVREPIIKNWMGLFWFFAIPTGVGFVRYAQIKGWL